MLRNELQTAINDVVVACEEAADGHEHAAEFLEQQDGEPVRLLRALAEQRRAAATEIGDQLRELGDLPKAPDTEAETVHDLIARIKAALSADERQAVLEDRAQAEAVIEQAVSAALRMAVPDRCRELLAQLQEETKLAQQRLVACQTQL
jgi:uncharacterized protein (TIGR02284 family)